MKTKYNIGEDVGIKGKVLSIAIGTDGIRYKVLVKGTTISFCEEDLSEIIDFDNMGEGELK